MKKEQEERCVYARRKEEPTARESARSKKSRERKKQEEREKTKGRKGIRAEKTGKETDRDWTRLSLSFSIIGTFIKFVVCDSSLISRAVGLNLD